VISASNGAKKYFKKRVQFDPLVLVLIPSIALSVLQAVSSLNFNSSCRLIFKNFHKASLLKTLEVVAEIQKFFLILVF
jgi:hypothetical protein